MTALGEYIQLQLDMRGWQQKDLVSRTRLGKGTISRLIAGEGIPEVPTLYKVAQALGVSLASLIERAGYPIGVSDLSDDDRALYVAIMSVTTNQERRDLVERMLKASEDPKTTAFLLGVLAAIDRP